jgi:hypothetical protein
MPLTWNNPANSEGKSEIHNSSEGCFPSVARLQAEVAAGLSPKTTAVNPNPLPLPDLAHIFLFPRIKSQLQMCHFQDVSRIQNNHRPSYTIP